MAIYAKSLDLPPEKSAFESKKFVKILKEATKTKDVNLENFTKDVNLPFKIKKVKPEQTLNLLTERKLLLKTVGNFEKLNKNFKSVSDPIFQDQTWNYLIESMENPAIHREIRRTEESQLGTKYIYDENEVAMKKKERENFYKGTRKTSTTLLPSHGKISGFRADAVGLLFNSEQCEIKDKYVFKDDAETLSHWWRIFIKNQNDPFLQNKLSQAKEEVQQNLETFSRLSFPLLKTLLESQESSDEPIEYNEVMASVKKEAISGIFFELDPNNDDQGSIDRIMLTAISRQQYCLRKLGMDAPIFEKSENGIKPFKREEQLQLIENILKDPARINRIVASEQDKIMDLFQDESNSEKPSYEFVKEKLLLKLNNMHQNILSADR